MSAHKTTYLFVRVSITQGISPLSPEIAVGHAEILKGGDYYDCIQGAVETATVQLVRNAANRMVQEWADRPLDASNTTSLDGETA